MNPPLLTLENLACGYHQQAVVKDLSLELATGEIACLLGPSGCGKTTTLRAIAGLEPVSGGSIHIQGRQVSSRSRQLPPEQRSLGMVFQEHALFPHLTVADNVAFGLRKQPRAQQRQRVSECLDRVRLAGMEDRYPHELSGGQQQRVALARALAPRPALLLLDEPFASLDLDLRRALARELGDILRQENVTTLLVTHDQEEAFALADRVGVMHQGRLEQWDSPYNIYHAPTNRFVAEFAGYGSFLRGEVLDENTVRTSLGELTGRSNAALIPGSQVDVLLRPEDVIADESAHLALPVTRRQFTGATILYHLRVGADETLLCQTDSHTNVVEGDVLRVRLATKHLVAFTVSEQ
ncbi:iron(III) transport system ATP-binding protein [Alcanivorax sp. DSM 26293]|uniref:ABC transporter ATP-binding protein n=1 Tax=Alcanivorax sp. DSM 26293 TaxID=1798238 RepID=UPI0008A0937D|nr:ABC transporter ATP-binding protein [Alcanivorax sp. DSM 26293]SEF46185.1 iron(III) transport system ATP-binding protein [Alcanivorax sp. DSM 26293]